MAPTTTEPEAATLTTEQQAAVDSVYAQVEAMATAIAGIVDSFDGINADGDSMFGTCPTVDVALEGTVATLTLTFPDGCTNEYYGTAPVTGSITVAFDATALTFNVTFNDFTTSSGTVTGTMALGFARDGMSVVLTGTVDLSISGVGTTTGTITLQFDADAGTITIADASLTLTATDATSFAVAITNLVISPVTNGNFIPGSGTISFDIPNSGPGPDTLTVVMTFDAQSPIDGTVSVKVGGGDPVEYQLVIMM